MARDVSFEYAGVSYHLRLGNDGSVTGAWAGQEPALLSVRWVDKEEMRTVAQRLGLGHKRIISNALRPLYSLGKRGALGLKMKGQHGSWSFELDSLEAAVENPAFTASILREQGGGPKSAELTATIIRHLRQELYRA